MDTNNPDENQANSADLNLAVRTILAEQRAWMARAERVRRRQLWCMWISNLTLHPITAWAQDRLTDLFG